MVSFTLFHNFSVAPFNSLIERDKTKKPNDNPGPGTYAAEKVKVVQTSFDNSTNAFTTKIDRFCPTYAGSTVFKPPTYIQNPGPGTHFSSLKFMGHPASTDEKRRIYGSKTHSELKVIPKPVPVGIPARKMAANAYTGLKQDTVGPALYDPNPDAQRILARDSDFGTSKTKRKIFEYRNERENT